MAWDIKARGRKGGYYYRSLRLPGRAGPVKVYLGTGSAAQAEAVAVKARRDDRSAATAEAAATAALDGPARDLADLCRTVAYAALAAAGLHRHRGTWRRRATLAKEGAMPAEAKRKPKAKVRRPRAKKPKDPRPWGWMSPDGRQMTLRNFARDAEKGDETARKHIRLMFEHYPELLADAGTLADRAERAYAEAAGMGDPAAVEAARREAEKMRKDLGGDTATGVEKLLIDQVVVCHLAKRHAQLLAAEGASFAVEAARLRRAEATGRRYLGALRHLALVQTKAGGRRPAGAGTRDC